MRPTLRPGLRILRRDRLTVQLGLDWPGLVLLPDSAALRAVLAAIDGFRDTEGVLGAARQRWSAEQAPGPSPHPSPSPSHRAVQADACADALTVLIECGAVIDSDPPPPATLAPSTWAAWSLLAGPQAHPGEIASRRSRHPITVDGHGVVAERTRALLREAGVTTTDDRSSADLVIVASDDEPSRRRCDTVMHLGVAHLWVFLRDLAAVVGPLVVPGRTACLRCVDEAKTDLDLAWPTLIEAATSRPVPDAAVEPSSAALAAAWVAHEASLWASDVIPQTYSRVLEVPYGSGSVESIAYEPHPRCGCGWFCERDRIGA